MTVLNWKATAQGSFNLPSNWQEGVAPQSGDSGTIGIGVARVIGENGDFIPTNFTLTGGTSLANTSASTQSFLSLTDTAVGSSFTLNETLPGGSYQGNTTGPVIRFGLGIHGNVNFAGTINVGAGDAEAFGIDASRYSTNTGIFNNTGTINLTGSGSNLAFANVNVGTEETNSTIGVYANYGTVNINDGIFVARATDVPSSGTATGASTFNLSNGSYLRFENDMHTNTTVNFLDGLNERLILAPDANNQISIGATINGFQSGDRIALVNTSAVGAVSYDASNHLLTVSDTTGNQITKLSIIGNFTTASFSFVQNTTPTSNYSSEYDITINRGGTSTANSSLFGSVQHSTVSGTADVYALYEALLTRAPDSLGLETFAASLQNGAAPANVAAAILASPEYVNQHSNGVTSGDFVSGLYANLLNRAPDAQGQAAYLGELNAGVDRATVATQIATSAEAQIVLGPTFQAGVFIPDAIDASVARLYYGALGRAPDANGLAAFEAQVKAAAAAGGTNGAIQGLANVAQTMLSSSEFANGHGNLSDTAFVDSLYVGALGRHAETGGSAYWTDQLAHGASRVQVALQIAESGEAQVHLVGQIEQSFNILG